MKSDIFLSEVVDKRETVSGLLEVCASADGQFDRATSHLVVRLDAYLQDLQGEKFRPGWLPQAETIREHAPREEIHEVGRDIFRRWVKRVHSSLPGAIPLGPDGKPNTAPAGN